MASSVVIPAAVPPAAHPEAGAEADWWPTFLQPNWHVLSGGHDIAEEWLQATGLRLGDPGGPVAPVQFAALLDYHHVLDTLKEWEAGVLGVDLDHLSWGTDFIPCFLCSYGYKRSHHAFDPRNPAHPALKMLDGYVFTDFRQPKGPQFNIYRPEGWPKNAIRLTGDKSAVSRFLNIPTLLFDDSEDNVDLHSRGHWRNEGVVVKRGMKAYDRVYRHSYRYSPDWRMWPGLIRDFQRRLEHDVWQLGQATWDGIVWGDAGEDAAAHSQALVTPGQSSGWRTSGWSSAKPWFHP